MERTLEKERGEKGDVHNILRRKEEHIEHLDSKVSSVGVELRSARLSRYHLNLASFV